MGETIYTTATASEVLGVSQDYVKRLAWKHHIGNQPGGRFTPYVFTMDDLKELAVIREWKRTATLEREDPRLRRLREVETPDALGKELNKLFEQKNSVGT